MDGKISEAVKDKKTEESREQSKQTVDGKISEAVEKKKAKEERERSMEEVVARIRQEILRLKSQSLESSWEESKKEAEKKIKAEIDKLKDEILLESLGEKNNSQQEDPPFVDQSISATSSAEKEQADTEEETDRIAEEKNTETITNGLSPEKNTMPNDDKRFKKQKSESNNRSWYITSSPIKSEPASSEKLEKERKNPQQIQIEKQLNNPSAIGEAIGSLLQDKKLYDTLFFIRQGVIDNQGKIKDFQREKEGKEFSIAYRDSMNQQHRKLFATPSSWVLDLKKILSWMADEINRPQVSLIRQKNKIEHQMKDPAKIKHAIDNLKNRGKNTDLKDLLNRGVLNYNHSLKSFKWEWDREFSISYKDSMNVSHKKRFQSPASADINVESVLGWLVDDINLSERQVLQQKAKIESQIKDRTTIINAINNLKKQDNSISFDMLIKRWVLDKNCNLIGFQRENWGKEFSIAYRDSRFNMRKKIIQTPKSWNIDATKVFSWLVKDMKKADSQYRKFLEIKK